MGEEAEDLAGIRSNAVKVVEQLGSSSGLDPFGFDAPSVQWIDGFIERQRVRDDVDSEFVGRMVSLLGSYLGECIIRSYGGEWSLDEGGWHVQFDANNAAFPFAKVQKQFANGTGDGVYTFFTGIPLAFTAPRPSGPRDNQRMQGGGAARWFSWLQKLVSRGVGR